MSQTGIRPGECRDGLDSLHILDVHAPKTRQNRQQRGIGIVQGTVQIA